eukprot:COSAG01_NODE_1453_length_10258_cov_38.080126_5_plen_191_part_00
MKQAPAWNAISKKYQNHAKVSFADIILESSGIETGPLGSSMELGEAGWPTIRYFNKQTGLDGKPYMQREPGKPICEELGDEATMEQYVINYGVDQDIQPETLEQEAGAEGIDEEEPEEGEEDDPDADHSGGLDCDEIYTWYSSSGVAFDLEACRDRYMQQFDEDGDGQLSQDEFASFVDVLDEAAAKEDL